MSDITDTASAEAAVIHMLAPEELPAEDKTEEQVPKPTQEAVEEAPKEETADEEKPADKSEGDDEVDVPSTIESLAEQYQVDPADLLGHLQAQVKVNGTTSTLSISEIVKGYQLEANANDKLKALADERRVFEQSQAQQVNEWQQRIHHADDLVAILEAQVTPPEDIDALLAEGDTDGYLKATRQQKARTEALERATDEREKLRREDAERRQNKDVQYRGQQQEQLRVKLPHLNDPVKADKWQGEVNSYMSTMGFTGDEVKQFYDSPFDHRSVLIINDAMRYRAVENAKPMMKKKLKGMPKVVKPGASETKVKDGREVALGKLKRATTKRTQNDAAVDYVRNLLE